MKDRRRQTRRQAKELLIACDSHSGAFIGEIADMTESGAMLLSRKPVPLNTTAKCVVALPDKIHGNDQFSFEAESRWCRLDEPSGMYQTGYEFQKLTPMNLKVIQELLKYWPVWRPNAVQS